MALVGIHDFYVRYHLETHSCLSTRQVLSDRVTILHNGSLLAEGEVPYLKKKFDAGFHLIVKHRHSMIYNQGHYSPTFLSLEARADERDNVSNGNVFEALFNHVKMYVPKATSLNEETVDDGGERYSDPFNDIQDESLLSRFHLPYVSANSQEEQQNLRNIQHLLSSLDQDKKGWFDDSTSNLHSWNGRFNIESYILDCTSLEQIFMSLLHVSILYGLFY